MILKSCSILKFLQDKTEPGLDELTSWVLVWDVVSSVSCPRDLEHQLQAWL